MRVERRRRHRGQVREPRQDLQLGRGAADDQLGARPEAQGRIAVCQYALGMREEHGRRSVACRAACGSQRRDLAKQASWSSTGLGSIAQRNPSLEPTRTRAKLIEPWPHVLNLSEHDKRLIHREVATSACFATHLEQPSYVNRSIRTTLSFGNNQPCSHKIK